MAKCELRLRPRVTAESRDLQKKHPWEMNDD